MKTKLRLSEMGNTRKTHPDRLTMGIDELVLNEINDNINKEIEYYNMIINQINLFKKEIQTLKEKVGPIDKEKIKELKNIIELKTKEKNDYKNSLENGEVSKKIINELSTKEVKNPNNKIKENLQLVGYKGDQLDKVDNQQAEGFVKNLIDVKFKVNRIRNEYSKKNKNYFATTPNS